MRPEDQDNLAHYIRQNMAQAGYSDSEIKEEIDIATSDLDQAFGDLAWVTIGLIVAAALGVAALVNWLVTRGSP